MTHNPPTDPTYTKLLALVFQEPENHHRKIVLAEYLEDSDPELSEAWLWMAENGYVPRYKPEVVEGDYEPLVVMWFSLDKYQVEFPDSNPAPDEIPDAVLSSMADDGGDFSIGYNSIQDAYEAAATAYVTARRTGWRPEVRT